jgi:hypothetical protein
MATSIRSWGTEMPQFDAGTSQPEVHSDADPAEPRSAAETKLAMMNNDPAHRAALEDNDHPGHRQAVEQRRKLFAAMHPNEERAPQPGELRQDPATGAWEPAEATPEELAATVAPVIQRHLVAAGARPGEATAIAEAAASAGLTATEISTVLDDRTYDFGSGWASLGLDAPELVERAKLVVNALGPEFAAFLERTQLGNSPRMIKLLAAKAELLEEQD